MLRLVLIECNAAPAVRLHTYEGLKRLFSFVVWEPNDLSEIAVEFARNYQPPHEEVPPAA